MPEQIVLRPVSEADEPYLLALRQAVMNEHFARLGDVPTEDAHRERLRHHYEDARLIVCDENVVGMVKAYRTEREWLLSQVQIAPPYQGRGLGETVVRLLLETAREDRLPVRLSVLKGNPARRLYERLGFVELERAEHATTLLWRPEQT
jgi:ribosomal protein S18 acetylase RimI-like enzyme